MRLHALLDKRETQLRDLTEEVEELRGLVTAADHLAIMVSDQGQGFDVETLSEERRNPTGEGRFGVIGMEERARIIGASITIASEPGKGTRVNIKMPYPQPR